jgi:hypothetical protein
MMMTTKEKNAVEEHLLKACGFHSATKQYKLIQLLFKIGELDFVSVDRDDAIDIRKQLWFLHFECAMRWDRIILTDEPIIKYYENVMGLVSESGKEEKSFFDNSNEL